MFHQEHLLREGNLLTASTMECQTHQLAPGSSENLSRASALPPSAARPGNSHPLATWGSTPAASAVTKEPQRAASSPHPKTGCSEPDQSCSSASLSAGLATSLLHLASKPTMGQQRPPGHTSCHPEERGEGEWDTMAQSNLTSSPIPRLPWGEPALSSPARRFWAQQRFQAGSSYLSTHLRDGTRRATSQASLQGFQAARVLLGHNNASTRHRFKATSVAAHRHRGSTRGFG